MPEIKPETTDLVDTIINLNADSSAYFNYLKQNDVLLNLKVYTPENWSIGSKFPCMVYFHGGAEDFSQYMKQCRYLSERGMVAITVNHRYSTNYRYTKAGLKDGHTAWRWLVQFSEELGIDSTKMVAGGSSAGATVALSCYLSPTYNHKSDNLSIGITPALFVLTNPYLIDFICLPEDASDHPPTLFFQGDDDNITPLSQVTNYCEEARQAGANEVNIKVYPGREHGFFNYGISPEDFYDILYSTDSLLIAKGYLQEISD